MQSNARGTAIGALMLDQTHYYLSPEAEAVLRAEVSRMMAEPHFANARTVRNELELETRLPLLLTMVALITAAQLLGSLVVQPWRERRKARRERAEETAQMAAPSKAAARNGNPATSEPRSLSNER